VTIHSKTFQYGSETVTLQTGEIARQASAAIVASMGDTVETLICRLIDRPLRPLFPKGFMNEVQVIATVMSLDPEISADIPALIGASAALACSGIPFAGPVGAAKVGYIDGEYVLNPSTTQMESTALDLVVAGTDQAVLMVESEADQLSESTMLDAVMFGHEQLQTAINSVGLEST